MQLLIREPFADQDGADIFNAHPKIRQPPAVTIRTRQVLDIDVAGFKKLTEPAPRALAVGLLCIATQAGRADLGSIEACKADSSALADDFD